jgi:hypothetical protein
MLNSCYRVRNRKRKWPYQSSPRSDKCHLSFWGKYGSTAWLGPKTVEFHSACTNEAGTRPRRQFDQSASTDASLLGLFEEEEDETCEF